MEYNRKLIDRYLDAEVAVLIMKTDSIDDVIKFQESIDDAYGSHVPYGGSLGSIEDWFNIILSKRDEDGMYVARDNRGPACTGFCDGEYYQENGYDLTTLKDVLAPGAGPEKYSNSDFDEVFG